MDSDAMKRVKRVSGASTYSARNQGRNGSRQIVIEEPFELDTLSSSRSSVNSSGQDVMGTNSENAAATAPVHQKRKRDSYESTEEAKAKKIQNRNQFSIDSDGETARLVYGDLSASKQVTGNRLPVAQHEIDPNNLIQMEILGSGHFGDVFMALLREADDKLVPVAVKRSKMSNNKKMTKDQRAEIFLQQSQSLQCELNIMSSLDPHPNILRLVGTVTRSPDEFCIITEYCEYGSMDKFLRAKKDGKKFINEYVVNGEDGYQLVMSECHWKIQDDSSWSESFEARRKEGIITTSDLMWFGFQIAHAMEFLKNQKVLHRDMALRNILLANGYIIKVADFGLSRKIVNELYQPQILTAMPIGYLAPEVLQDSQFSNKSECWSFGIVLWELFTFAARQPYLEECGDIDRLTISAFLGANNRLSIPEIAPLSMQHLISQLWLKEPADRPDFDISQSVIMEDLQIANPKLAVLAQRMRNNDCVNYSDETEPKMPYVKFSDSSHFDGKPIHVNETRASQTARFLKVFLCCCSSLVLLLILAILGYFGYHAWFGQRQVHSGFVAARWTWTFKASDAYNTTRNKTYGPEGVLNLGAGSGCGILKWQPFFDRKEIEKNRFNFTFLLQYEDGPKYVRAWRSMLLVADDGREIMSGNDYKKNGFEYAIEQFDTQAWAATSQYLPNTSVNDPLTLKIEVFVNPAWINCEYKKEIPQQPINFEEECKRVPTKAKLFYNGVCYVGSNTHTNFAYANQLCNDIPTAKISRLAWIESEDLLEKLRHVLIIHDRSGKKVIEPYFIGAQLLRNVGNEQTSSHRRWFWIDSNPEHNKPFPENFSLWGAEESIDEERKRAAIFDRQKKLSAVNGREYFRFLCEYRGKE